MPRITPTHKARAHDASQNDASIKLEGLNLQYDEDAYHMAIECANHWGLEAGGWSTRGHVD